MKATMKKTLKRKKKKKRRNNYKELLYDSILEHIGKKEKNENENSIQLEEEISSLDNENTKKKELFKKIKLEAKEKKAQEKKSNDGNYKDTIDKEFSEYNNVAIHLDLIETEEISLINEFLFSFLITRFYIYNENIIYYFFIINIFFIIFIF